MGERSKHLIVSDQPVLNTLRGWLVKQGWSDPGAVEFCARLDTFHQDPINTIFQRPLSMGVAAHMSPAGYAEILLQVQLPPEVSLHSVDCANAAREIGGRVRKALREGIEEKIVVGLEYADTNLIPFESTVERLSGEKFDFLGEF